MRRIRTIAATLALTVALTPAVSADAKPREDATLERYAASTWQSFVRMIEPRTGLPADYIGGQLRPGTRSEFTSPTNMAMYMWATLAARDMGMISATDAIARMTKTLRSVDALERHDPSGQFYNWYDPETLAKITIWPENGDPVYPFLSSVDNGWMASGLIMVANAIPELYDQAWTLATSMDFGCYYDPLAKGEGTPGLIRGGFWTAAAPPPGSDGFPRDDYCAMGEDVVYTGHHYGAFNTEPRIASYIGIAFGQIPAEHYFGPWRTFPNTCDWSWSEQQPSGEWRTYDVGGVGVDVFQGTYRYNDKLLVPTWGGSMFEALMVPLVVPEAEWGPESWGVNHPLFAEAQIEFGLEEAGYGYWGFSPASDPAGGYREYGVDAIGMEPNGYAADVDRLTHVDYGWDDPNCQRAAVPITDYGEGVVTPHAAFLALDVAPEAALENLANMFVEIRGLYGRGGFKDSFNVATGQVADRYLALDQGMIIAAIANYMLDDQLQDYMAVTLQPSLQPLMGIEDFEAGRTGP